MLTSGSGGVAERGQGCHDHATLRITGQRWAGRDRREQRHHQVLCLGSGQLVGEQPANSLLVPHPHGTQASPVQTCPSNQPTHQHLPMPVRGHVTQQRSPSVQAVLKRHRALGTCSSIDVCLGLPVDMRQSKHPKLLSSCLGRGGAVWDGVLSRLVVSPPCS